MNGASLPVRRGKSPQTLQESLVLVVTGGLIGPQALVEDAAAVVRPDASRECGGSCNGSRVAPGSKAVDEGIRSVDADPELECPVVVPQGGWFSHGVPVVWW